MAYLLSAMPDQESGQPVAAPPPLPLIDTRAGKIALTPGGLVDTGKAVGVEIIGGFDASGNPIFRNAEVIPDGTPYGQEFEKDFATSMDDMTEIPLILYEGADPDPANCVHLASLTISGLPLGRPQGKRVRVKLGYDPNGIIRGEGVDVETGRRVDIVIDRHKS
jgi:molecular chaperone DnaK (HSP70)